MVKRHDQSICRLAFGLGWAQRNHVLAVERGGGAPDPPGKGAIMGGRHVCPGMPAVGIFNKTMRRFIEILRSLVTPRALHYVSR